jgi:hypothetical protein
MVSRLSPALLLACAALAAPTAAHASAGSALPTLHLHGHQQADASTPTTAKQAAIVATRLKQGIGVKTGFELTPVLKTLALKLPQLHGAERRQAERLLMRPTQGQTNPGEEGYQVPEAPPVCGPHFCIHYVQTTGDAPSLVSADGDATPDYVQAMLREFEHVYEVENVQMGWRAPKPDAGRGGDDRTDVYIKNIGPGGIFGYAAPDPGQQGQQVAAFQVMDNDYAQAEYRNYSTYLAPLQVTAAHEYNHILQFNYDLQQDNWMFEATAVWMEDKVYDDINDYRNYLPEWAKRSTQPLTQFTNEGNNVKVYGDVVFNRWIDERFGQDVVRRAWEVSQETKSFAPAAYQKALGEKGQNFFNVFTAFATDTAEWRSASAFFEEGNTFPDMARSLGGAALPPQDVSGDRNDFVEGGLDHTAYALVNVDPRGQNRLTLGGTFRRGIAGSIALVGRTGDELGGTATVAITRLPNGGPGKVTLDNAASFSRVTAVIVNADTKQSGYSQQVGDWIWLGDSEPITLALNDFTKAKLAKVTFGSRVQLTFSESVAGISGSSVKLIAPNGRSVRLRALTQSKNGRVVKLTPKRPLPAGGHYTVKLSNAITDPAGNPLPGRSRTKGFTTR